MVWKALVQTNSSYGIGGVGLGPRLAWLWNRLKPRAKLDWVWGLSPVALLAP